MRPAQRALWVHRNRRKPPWWKIGARRRHNDRMRRLEHEARIERMLWDTDPAFVAVYTDDERPRAWSGVEVDGSHYARQSTGTRHTTSMRWDDDQLVEIGSYQRGGYDPLYDPAVAAPARHAPDWLRQRG